MNKTFTNLQKSQVASPHKRLNPTTTSTVSVILKTVLLTFFLLCFLLTYNAAFAQTVYCTMVCNDNLNISVGNECSVTIRYDQIMEDADNSYTCSPNGRQAFTIDVMDENLNVIPTSPTIPYEYVGRTLTVKVKHWATGNNCWASITLNDKIPPRLVCPPNISVPCTASLEPEYTGKASVTDCSTESNITYEDIFSDLNCGNPVGEITRIWKATDAHGNTSQCTQIISIERPTFSSIQFPANLDAISNTAISCAEVSENSERLSPTYTGYPTINGRPINGLSGEICKLNSDYEDQIISSCGGTYKIIRTWTVLNWCTSELETEIQIIEVEDRTPPVIKAPADLKVGTRTLDCFANVPLLPAAVSDACSEDISVKITSRFSDIEANGGTLLDIPIGIHLITYEATDACGNQSSDAMRLEVIDDVSPIVICNDETVVSLTSDGTATAFAQTFDGGSYDNCCLEELTVRRVGDELFGPSVQFLCTDDEVMIELKATDCYGNENTCMVNVSIQDKVAPTIVCPADQIVDCDYDYSDLNQFGQPQIFDNCGFEIVSSVVEDLNNCGQGTIKRTWTAMGSSGGVASCTQTITFVNSNPWNRDNNLIEWPADHETSECQSASALNPEDLPEGYGEPSFSGDNVCALIATNYEDLVLEIEAPACFKILRTWTVIDWCNYDPNSGSDAGRFEHEQVIKVIDDTAPKFISTPNDFTIQIIEAECGTTLTLPNFGVDDCSPNASITAQSIFGTGFGPFTNVQPGKYEIKYIATDGCGNSISEDITLTVEDATKPTPICIDGLALTLNKGADSDLASVELWAIDLDAKSFDNCTAEGDLSFKIRKRDADDNTVPETDNITFTCDELGVQEVEIWVIDESGNADFCITTVTIQDNQDVCGSGVVGSDNMIALSGKISTASGAAVSEVNVQISHPDKDPYVTGDDGIFQYEALPGDRDYALIPEKNTAPTNGVSTLDLIKMRKHLLGLSSFESPYQMIAADVDQSGYISTLDLIQVRKLILGLIDDFPNNESWRFVSKAYEFAPNEAPLQADFPEIAIVSKDANNHTQVDFVAVKIGDVDGTAQSNGLQISQPRNDMPTMGFELQDQVFEAAEIVEVNFSAKDFKEIMGYQLELNFNQNIIDYQDFEALGLTNLTEANIGSKHINRGKIKMSWDNIESQTIEDGTILFSFRFIAKEAGKLSQIIKIAERGLESQAYTKSEMVYNLQLLFEEERVAEKNILHQNQPNPFYQQTTIPFELSKAQNATLRIMDLNGKILKTYQGFYEKGHQAIRVDKADIGQTGMLYYTLETGDEQLIKKLIVVQ